MDAIFSMDAARAATFKLTLDMAVFANEAARKAFELAKDGWKNQATRNRELGLPLPPKPEAPLTIRVVPIESANPEMDGWPRRVDGPDAVAEPVPDLEPLPVQSQPSSPVGAQIGNTNWYGCVIGDTSPNGTVAMKDGVTFRKVTYPFGGWWVRE